MYGYEKYYNRAAGMATDPQKLSNFFKLHKKELGSWLGLVVVVMFVYHLFSDGDFSFSLTLSGLVQMFGFLMIHARVSLSKNCSGLSLQTLICYSVSFLAKLSSILFSEGYLPTDRSGDFVYRIVDVLAFLLCIRTAFLVKYRFKSSYNWEFDTVNAVVLIVPALILAMCIHPAFNKSYFYDVAWTFALYLEALAMFPQIFLFSKKGGEIESFTSHYVASQGFSRVLAIVFWYFSYTELNEVHGKQFGLFKNYVGQAVMFAQILQVVILSDFIYRYIKSVRKGLPMSLPTYVC